MDNHSISYRCSFTFPHSVIVSKLGHIPILVDPRVCLMGKNEAGCESPVGVFVSESHGIAGLDESFSLHRNKRIQQESNYWKLRINIKINIVVHLKILTITYVRESLQLL